MKRTVPDFNLLRTLAVKPPQTPRLDQQIHNVSYPALLPAALPGDSSPGSDDLQ